MTRGTKLLTAITLCIAFFAGACSYDVEIAGREQNPDLTPNPDFDGLKKRPGLEWYELAQGWNSEMRRAYWFTPQGSALVPYDWFLHLEMAERNCKGQPDPALNKGQWKYFRDAGHMRSLGYIPAPSDPVWNPDGLPIGFAKSPTPEGDFMGPTCAACHSNLMVLGKRKVLVEGAPTLSDLESLNRGLANALCSMDHEKVKARAQDRDSQVAAAKAQFTRFAKRVLKSSYSPDSTQTLFKRLQKQRKRIEIRNARNYSQKTDIFPPYGKGRLDALGAILNEVSTTAAKVAGNSYPANAPVSYPFLWGASQSDVVQWNGAVDNQGFGLGPLGRNVGEVVGVYGHVDVTPVGEGKRFFENFRKRLASLARQGKSDRQLPPPLIDKPLAPQLGGFGSSVMMANLGSIERWISTLRSPKWPEEALGKIDRSETVIDKSGTKRGKVEWGRQIYMGTAAKRVKCVGCHQLIKREDQDKPYQTTMVRVPEIGTDPAAANNFILGANPTDNEPWQTGQFKGMKKNVLFGDRYGDYFTFRGEALATVVVGVILGDLVTDGLKGAYRSRSVSEATKFINPADKLFRYKARPLTGIWATAPYLHNGSVANLRQLLTPEDKRMTQFCVGNREFDPRDVGFLSALDKNGRCGTDPYGSTLLDTSKFGNSNKGHSTQRHGVNMSDAQKDALIEFLKTL